MGFAKERSFLERICERLRIENPVCATAAVLDPDGVEHRAAEVRFGFSFKFVGSGFGVRL